MPVDGGALGTVVVDADGDGVAVGDGDGEVVWASATPKVKRPETPNPAAANAAFLIIISPPSLNCLFNVSL